MFFLLLIALFVGGSPVCAVENSSGEEQQLQDREFTNLIGMKFVLITHGVFTMGSPYKEAERDSDERQVDVKIANPFYLQTTEVTVGQWKFFSLETGYKTEAERKGWAWIWDGARWKKNRGICWRTPGFPQTDMHPVTCISWNDTQEFIKWLNRKDGKHYRLPTEAEWEYACRARTTTPFHTGNCISTNEANYDGRYPMPGCPEGVNRKKTVFVASFEPNPWGLYDMHGNVWEWCQDWKANYLEGIATSPQGPLHGRRRVMRGGSWYNKAGYLRSADRSKGIPDVSTNYLGFRVAADF